MFPKTRLWIIFLLAFSLLLTPVSFSYTLWLFSQSKTAQEILDIEEKIPPNKFQTIAIVFDTYSTQGSEILNTMVNRLGTNRNYHITLAPDMYTAKEVAEGKFDAEYTQFFEDVKLYNIKVFFRTMHEMNGGWYSRSSDPVNFKKAWMRVRDLSRAAGLDQSQIQFIFSLNIHDMPVDFLKLNAQDWLDTSYRPHQKSPLMSCTPKAKLTSWCYLREDYYPESKYVDIIWFTAYNRGKATSNRRWLSFDQIINDPIRNQWNRIKSVKKPIYIDEIGTTAVRYDESFNREQSQDTYSRASISKNKWLRELAHVVSNTPEIVGMNYFNVDYTNGLRELIVGEADWKIFDAYNGCMYLGARDLIEKSDKLNAEFAFAYKKKEIKKPTELLKKKLVSNGSKISAKITATE